MLFIAAACDILTCTVQHFAMTAQLLSHCLNAQCLLWRAHTIPATTNVPHYS
jgi:hypothetical protein